jgi:hypothetical protein
VEDPAAQAESGLTVSDQRLLTGVLEYKGKRWDGRSLLQGSTALHHLPLLLDPADTITCS